MWSGPEFTNGYYETRGAPLSTFPSGNLEAKGYGGRQSGESSSRTPKTPQTQEDLGYMRACVRGSDAACQSDGSIRFSEASFLRR